MSKNSADAQEPQQLRISTTVTADAARLAFGAVGNLDYRSHPGDRKDEDPLIIYEGMVSKELPPLEDIRILKNSIYSFKNRKIITRWMRDVSQAFHLKTTTLCLAVQLTDGFVIKNLQTLILTDCQLAAVTSLWIAAKFEEMDEDLPSLRKVVEVCDNAYTATNVLEMEERILHFFKWRLPHTTIANHVYLQIHTLNSEALIKRTALVPAKGNQVTAYLLTVNPQTQDHSWQAVSLDATKTVKDYLPGLCTAVSLHFSSSIDAFQIHGTNFFLSERLEVERKVGELQGDQSGTLRIYLTSARNQLSSIFVERGSLTILRSVNTHFLNLCEVLTQEAVTHVEFLQLRCHCTANGIVALALCLQEPQSSVESKAMITHILTTLKMSASRGLATADLLSTKYTSLRQQVQQPTATYPPVPEDITKRLENCFGRELPAAQP